MNSILRTVIIAAVSLFSFNLDAQNNKCSTMQILEQRMKNDPSVQLRMEQSERATQKWIAERQLSKKASNVVITIPVVVHVIYHDSVENISDAQIQSQIDVLNKDFRKLNSDTLGHTHPFSPLAADAEIEFCMARRDPAGSPTTGITRTYTDTVSFSGIGIEKHSASGGEDNWDPTQYLNLWVCNLDSSGGTLGYAAFPSDLATNPSEDGVVIRYQAFGTGTAAPNDRGRTATHEVGHWLNLRHIWGDNEPNCGDDFVADTPPAFQPHYHCPIFPINPNDSCGTNANGDMYMNYMDYVDDYCMKMFTAGQATRMQAALNGDRSAIVTSMGCADPIGVIEVAFENGFEIYPNPGNGNFEVNILNQKSVRINITVFDLLGSSIRKYDNIKSFPCNLNLSAFSNGIYYLRINNDAKSVVKRIIISK